MSTTDPEYQSVTVGLRRAIHTALRKHPRIRSTGTGVRCSGSDCDWVKPAEGNKSTTARFVNHQTFEVQQAVTAWLRGREEAERVSRETLHVL